MPGLILTIDPVENRGLDYSGVGFTIFSRQAKAEIGRGGRYLAHGEPSVGATLFMDTLLGILPDGKAPKRIYLPPGTDPAVAAKLRGEGWVTINGLNAGDSALEAKRLRCGHLLAPTGPKEI
jgi:ATP phosphoribosyltransferase regulatory subunit